MTHVYRSQVDHCRWYQLIADDRRGVSTRPGFDAGTSDRTALGWLNARKFPFWEHWN